MSELAILKTGKRSWIVIQKQSTVSKADPITIYTPVTDAFHNEQAAADHIRELEALDKPKPPATTNTTITNR